MAGGNQRRLKAAKHRDGPYAPPPLIEDRHVHHRAPPPESHRLSQSRIHLIEDRIASQHQQIQSILVDNHRLAATHVALKNELGAAQQELRHLSATAASVEAERDAEVRKVYEKSRIIEAELRSRDGLSAELALVREDVEKLSADRKKLTGKLQEIDGEVDRVRPELQQFLAIKAEIEAMHKEVQKGRAAIEYEKKMQASNLEQSQAMDKHMITLSSEIEKLQAELANAEKKAMATVAAASASTPNPVYAANYGNPETGFWGNSYPAPYPVHQVQGSIHASNPYGQSAVSYGHYGMQQPHAHQ